MLSDTLEIKAKPQSRVCRHFEEILDGLVLSIQAQNKA